MLVRGFKRARNMADRWLIWCFAGGLIGWNMAMMTVSAMDQVEILLYMFIALTGNLPAVIGQGAQVHAHVTRRGRFRRRQPVRPRAIPYPEGSHG